MSYLDKKNEELKQLQERLAKQLEDRVSAANHELKNPDWEMLSRSAVEQALGELGFSRSTEQIKSDAEMWTRSHDGRSILIPKQHADEKRPRGKRKRRAFTLIGALTVIFFALLYLANLGVLGPLGDGLQYIGRQLTNAEEGQSVGLVALIGTVVGLVLIGVGFLFAGAQKVYDYGTKALAVYFVLTAATEWVSNTASGLNIAAIDREFERISGEMNQAYQEQVKRVDDEFTKLRREQMKHMKTHYIERLRSQYDL